MAVRKGIHVRLRDRDGNDIEEIDGKVEFPPGEEFQVIVGVRKRQFDWQGASRLYVAIASRDDKEPMDLEHNVAQVVCVRKEALTGRALVLSTVSQS